MSKEKEALVDYFLKVDLRRQKVATTLKKFKENKATISNLQSKKARLENELLEMNQQLTFLEGSQAQVLTDAQTLNLKLATDL